MELVLSTRNPHKLRELQPLLAPHTVVPLPDEVELPPETGQTFAENALGKARAAAEATGRPAVADDSGIAAEALDGAPGVRSARYAGEHAAEPRGTGGFGYDPAFVPVEHPDRTMAELAPEEKDAISHRGRAARALLEWLGSRGG